MHTFSCDRKRFFRILLFFFGGLFDLHKGLECDLLVDEGAMVSFAAVSVFLFPSISW